MWSVTLLLLTRLLFAGVTHAESPRIQVDLRFLEHPTLLERPSPAATKAYLADVSDPLRHPVFARDVVLSFGDHEAHVVLIASRHDGESDFRFIQNAFAEMNVPPSATLFIEQGDSFGPDGSVTELRRLVGERAPKLTSVLNASALRKASPLNPALLARSPFQRAAREWASHGGRVVNFDASANFSDAAIAFLAQNLGSNGALRFVRENLHGESLSIADFRQLIAQVYPSTFTMRQVAEFPDCCANLRVWAREIADDFPLRDRVRERFMKTRLASELRDGDVIVTHPVHMDHLLSHEAP